MSNDFSTEYSEWGDDELLLLASDPCALTTEAAAALNAELRRRNLTESDQAKYQQDGYVLDSGSPYRLCFGLP